MSTLWESPPQQDKYDVTVSRWFIECEPHLHPLWHHYLVICVALKDIEGLPPAHKQFPEATHEIIVVALNRDNNPTYDNDNSHQILTPVNYVYQFVATNEEAKKITYDAANMFKRGQMLLEISGIYGAKTINDQMMSALVRRETGAQ